VDSLEAGVQIGDEDHRMLAVCGAAVRVLQQVRDEGGHIGQREEASAMSVSEPFVKLKDQVDAADRRIRAAAAEDTAELKAMVDKARKSADEHAAELRAKSDDVADQTERHWQQVQSDWDGHIKRIRARIDAKKAELDADDAEREAEWAAADASDAIEFASAAIEEAEYAMLDAVLARKDADVMAAST
jgi:hypothetical protein